MLHYHIWRSISGIRLAKCASSWPKFRSSIDLELLGHPVSERRVRAESASDDAYAPIRKVRLLLLVVTFACYTYFPIDANARSKFDHCMVYGLVIARKCEQKELRTTCCHAEHRLRLCAPVRRFILKL